MQRRKEQPGTGLLDVTMGVTITGSRPQGSFRHLDFVIFYDAFEAFDLLLVAGLEALIAFGVIDFTLIVETLGFEQFALSLISELGLCLKFGFQFFSAFFH